METTIHFYFQRDNISKKSGMQSLASSDDYNENSSSSTSSVAYSCHESVAEVEITKGQQIFLQAI